MFVFSGVACAVIFNYYNYHEFCFFVGGVRGYFFKLLLLSRVLFLRGWRARLLLIIIAITNFVFIVWRARLFFNLLLLPRVLFFVSGAVFGYF